MQPYKIRLCCTKVRKLLTLAGVIVISTLGIPELDGRFVYHRLTDFGSDCGALSGLTPATQWYQVCLYPIKTLEIAVFCKGYIRYH